MAAELVDSKAAAASPTGATTTIGPVVGMVTTIKNEATGGRVAFDLNTCNFRANFTGASEASTTVVTRTTKVTPEQMAYAKKAAADMNILSVMLAVEFGNSICIGDVHAWFVLRGTGHVSTTKKDNANGTTSTTLVFTP